MKNSGNIISGRYSLVLAILAVLLALVSLLLGWLAFGLHAWITFFNVLILWVVLFVVIFYRIRRVNKDVARFFEMIGDQDIVQHFDLGKSDPLFVDLHSQMNNVASRIAALRDEKEQDFQFFRTIFDHADAGLLVHDDQGQIVMINKAAGSLLGTRKPASIHDIDIPLIIRPGIKTPLRVNRNGGEVLLSLRSRRIRISGRNLTLLSLQNIRLELEQHEVESWQKLIRVFIHEIMNSVSPITLTSSGILGILEKSDNQLNDLTRGEIMEGLRAIRKRSKGISAFMDSYRQLSRVPVPEFSWVPAEKIIENVSTLMQQDLHNRNIRFSISHSPREIMIWCDEKLIEHVLINLLKNAEEALHASHDPEIRISGVYLPDQAEITVQDNGTGIDPDMLGSIFIPFFTTKPEGTGIGLSLSRQIMNLHGGSIFVSSKKGETVFTLNFPIK